MPRSDGKPAGFRFYPEDVLFWTNGVVLRCKTCGKQTAKAAPSDARHSPFCEHYAGGPIVKGPDLLPATVGDFEREAPIEVELRRVEKRGKAEKSPIYRQWCKKDVCANCGAWPCDPHHEDTTIPALRRGVGTKARDTLCVPLCRRCHDSLEDVGGGYRLPVANHPEARHQRAESLAILHDAQEERLRRALDLLPQEWRIEALSAGIARAPEAVLKRALLTGDADDRLAEALDLAGEEPI